MEERGQLEEMDSTQDKGGLGGWEFLVQSRVLLFITAVAVVAEKVAV